MEIQISGSKTLSEISDEFNLFFPYLKLNFFKRKHDESEPSTKKEMLDADQEVKALKAFKGGGKIEFDVKVSVAEFEQNMQEKFGLNVQVFRKSGNVWLETTATDHLSLRSQNALGHEKSLPVQSQDFSDIDYD